MTSTSKQIGVYGSAKLVAIRVSRLNADCTPAMGTMNSVATAAIVKVDAQPQFQDGKEYILVDGNGDISLYAKDVDRLKNQKLDMTLATRDFELIELLTGSTLVTSVGRVDVASGTSTSAVVTDATIATSDFGSPVTAAAGIPPNTYVGTVTAGVSFKLSSVSGSQVDALYTGSTGSIVGGVTIGAGEVIGLGRRGVGAGPPGFVGVEIWTKTIDNTGVCHPIGGILKPQWYRLTWPNATFALGNSTFENDVATVVLQGFTLSNPNWGSGPFDDYPGATFPASTTEVEILDAAGPPTLQPGYISVTAPVTPTSRFTGH